MKVDEVLTKVPSKYANFADVFSPKLVVELPKHIRINNYAIKLVDDLQLLYNPIYNFVSVELEILKAYIKNHLANGFIKPFKSLTTIFIVFDKKLDGSLRLYVD